MRTYGVSEKQQGHIREGKETVGCVLVGIGFLQEDKIISRLNWEDKTHPSREVQAKGRLSVELVKRKRNIDLGGDFFGTKHKKRLQRLMPGTLQRIGAMPRMIDGAREERYRSLMSKLRQRNATSLRQATLALHSNGKASFIMTHLVQGAAVLFVTMMEELTGSERCTLGFPCPVDSTSPAELFGNQHACFHSLRCNCLDGLKIRCRWTMASSEAERQLASERSRG